MRSRSPGTTGDSSFNSVSYKAMLEDAVRKPGKLERAEGDADAALKSAAKVITAEYYSPHLAHATMEPPAATARMADGKLEIWTSVQSPGGARDDVAERLGTDAKNVTLHNMLLGGGFGRKVEVELRHRGGASDQGHGRRAGQGGVDARG